MLLLLNLVGNRCGGSVEIVKLHITYFAVVVEKKKFNSGHIFLKWLLLLLSNIVRNKGGIVKGGYN